ncbi:Interactor of constitutive active ROPs 2-chloroplastic [Striga hermonthica]|uniref:Interactor of constitutive active ROPs 2-chloroplastic n=1 Tax=Striga hermonthica TaxID=68872 RepID=A0A9N7RGL9_STRHE|nr:Interactor of constitutive active ROPs 2-chloroplastic [Striga hermonthica]
MNLLARTKLFSGGRSFPVQSFAGVHQSNHYSTKTAQFSPKTQRPAKNAGAQKPSDSVFSHESKKRAGLTVDCPKPIEIPYQVRAANSVNLIGRVRKPVQFESGANGNHFAAAVIAQEGGGGGRDSLVIPVVFEGDLAQAVACHVEEKDSVFVSGRLSMGPTRFAFGNGLGRYHLVAENFNFVEGFAKKKNDKRSGFSSFEIERGSVRDGVSSAKVEKPLSENVECDEEFSQKWKEAIEEAKVKTFSGEGDWASCSVSRNSNIKAKSLGHVETKPEKGDNKNSPSANKKKKKKKKNGEQSLDLWRDLVKSPKKWWDFRAHKSNGLVKENFPDFKHKDTADSLWVNNAPDWVLPGLARLEIDVKCVKDNAKKDSWMNLVENPSKWWDNRSEKKNSRYPDFKHKETGEGLWLNDDTPSWVLPGLARLEFDVKCVKDNAKKDSWMNLVENPSKWWDNRLEKKNSRYPDFKHKETGEGLWLNDDMSSWVLSRPGSLNVPQKRSPTKPNTERKLKTQGSDSDPSLSPSPVRKTPKDRSPINVERRSPRTPAVEKKKPSKVSELDSQLAHLQDELKIARDQLVSSESCKKKAEQDADEAKIQLATILAQLDKTQKQLHDLSDSEDARIEELRKISQERDKAWQSELEAIQKQHSMDSSALASALNEIQRLKSQLNKVSESEASQARHAESAHAEVHSLRIELEETLKLVETLKSQLTECRESEERALEEVCGAQMVLEVVKNAEEKLNLENGNVMELYKSLLVELNESRSKVSFLEGLVQKFQADFANVSKNNSAENEEIMKTEIDNLRNEVSRLRDALEDAERRYRDEYLEMTEQIKDANELVKLVKIESCKRESELEAKLNESKAEFEELKTKMIEKENAVQSELEFEQKKAEYTLEDLKANLVDKEMRLQAITEENESLKSEILKKEAEKSEERDGELAKADAARAAEREVLMKLKNMTEEADKSSRKAERLAKELDAAQAAGSEMEAELRRLKVQSDQWRKAAEAAAAMLSDGNNNGKFVEKMGGLDYQIIGGKMGSSPFSDDDLGVKKNGNVLKKIGVLLKKGQK